MHFMLEHVHFVLEHVRFVLEHVQEFNCVSYLSLVSFGLIRVFGIQFGVTRTYVVYVH